MVSNLNHVYDDMHSVIIENEKTALYEMYYDVELNNGSKGVSKREWNRLISRLSVAQRERLEKIGTFEEIAGNDYIMSFQEFQDLVKKTLQSYEKEIIKQSGMSISI